MRFWGAHGVAIIATLWLLAFVAGISAIIVIAVGIPPMVLAWKAYLGELRYRRRQ